MLRVIGFCIVILGSAGFGYAYIQTKKEALKELEKFIYFFRLLESEVSYHKESLPEAVVRVGRKMEKGMGEIFSSIEETCVYSRQKNFGEAWHFSVKPYLENTQLCMKERNVINGFADYAGYEDKSLQESMIRQYIDELERCRKEKEVEISEKQRVVMGISSILGLMISIILL